MRNNILKVILVGLMLVLIGGQAKAQMMGLGSEEGHEEHESLEDVLAALLLKYNAETIQDLSCDELSSEDFERLGDGVMEDTHPGEAHERMDAMMGGEESESLEEMHIQMGKGYLRCGSSYVGSGMSGDRGSMMGIGNYMMSWDGYGSFGNTFGLYHVLGVGLWVLVAVFLVSGIRYFWKKSK